LSKRGKRRGASQHKDDEIAEKVFLLILARAKLSKERDVMMMREILIGDFLFNERLFLVTLFFCLKREALLLFLSESTHRRHRRERLLVELFLGREGGALSLLLTCSLIKTQREKREF
jgi:hypothetical protein